MSKISKVIMREIEKAEKQLKYYSDKQHSNYFMRDGKPIYNNDDWIEYWRITKEYWEDLIDDYYILLKIVSRDNLGGRPYPNFPNIEKEYINEVSDIN